MNQHTAITPLKVTDPKIRKLLQIAGLRFVYSRARWLASEAETLGKAIQSNGLTCDEVDERLTEMGILDLVYPELMSEAV
ncbi:hypothetical protein [Bradyrhizobium sp. 27S5]|uniref:hypothetical protein n=1 Tax=Bradyrhizobium sp. 27S5 TaxID=3139728 RepID=UPI0030D46407